MRIAAVGCESDIRGFALAGAETFACDDEATTSQVLQRLEGSGDHAVIVMTQRAARLAPREVARLQQRVSLPIPCVLGPATTDRSEA